MSLRTVQHMCRMALRPGAMAGLRSMTPMARGLGEFLVSEHEQQTLRDGKRVPTGMWLPMCDLTVVVLMLINP
jgi:hypothetical protein